MAKSRSLRDNETVTISPTYGNLTKSRSKKDDGFYYTIKGTVAGKDGNPQEDALNFNFAGAKAIQGEWCGRGGQMSIERLNHSRFEVAIIEEGESYPLEMQRWNESTRTFQDVEFTDDLDAGVDEDMPLEVVVQEAKESAQRAKEARQEEAFEDRKEAPTPTPAKTSDRPNLVALAHATWIAAQGIIEVEDAEVQYKWAYTLYADARRLGLSAADIIADNEAFFSEGEDDQYPEEEPPPEELGDAELPF